MPLHTPTVLVARLARAAAVAGVCLAAGTATVAIADDKPPIGETATTRYFDIEANKAASMRALGDHIAAQRASDTSRYADIEANKAHSQSAR
jgi:hypothetical protein